MKIKQQLNHIYKALAVLWQLDRMVLIVSILSAVLQSSIPYLEIYLSAYVLDHLVAGLSFKPFLQTVLLFLAVILLLRILIAYLEKLIETHIEICGKKYGMLMSIRTLTMDYELLEAPQVNDIRTRIRNDTNWGSGFYSILYQFPYFVSCIANLLLAVVVLVPLFTDSRLFKDYLALPVLLLFFCIILFNIRFSGKKQEALHALMHEDDESNDRYRSYYLWNYQEYRQGIDIRIFKGQKAIENHILTEFFNNRGWIRRYTENRPERPVQRSLLRSAADCRLSVCGFPGGNRSLISRLCHKVCFRNIPIFHCAVLCFSNV